jgi:hypothetical protein
MANPILEINRNFLDLREVVLVSDVDRSDSDWVFYMVFLKSGKEIKVYEKLPRARVNPIQFICSRETFLNAWLAVNNQSAQV